MERPGYYHRLTSTARGVGAVSARRRRWFCLLFCATDGACRIALQSPNQAPVIIAAKCFGR